MSTVNSSLRVLGRALRQGAEWGLLQTVPRIKMLPGERHRERVLSFQEEARYLAVASEPLCWIATVLSDTGMRPEECYRLRWETITWVAMGACSSPTERRKQRVEFFLSPACQSSSASTMGKCGTTGRGLGLARIGKERPRGTMQLEKAASESSEAVQVSLLCALQPPPYVLNATRREWMRRMDARKDR